MELLIIVVIAFFVGKMFGSKKKESSSDWPDEPVEYASPKKKGCSSCLLSLAFWGFVLIAFAVLISSLSGESADVDAASPDPTSAVSAPADPTATPTAKPTAKPTPTPTVEPTLTPEPDTLQGWAEYVAHSVYGGPERAYPDFISVECMQVDGESAPMIILNVKYPSSFLMDNDGRMGVFLYNVMRTTELLDELADQGKLEYGSVYVHGRSMFMDEYGNEFEADAASIRIKASEASKVNWDNFSSDMLPNIAVSFGTQPVIREGLTREYYNKIRKK